MSLRGIMPRPNEKVIATAKIYSGYRISIIRVKDILDIEPGDSIKIVKKDREIILRKVKP